MSANNKLLNIISWNAQSISNRSKQTEFALLLKQHNIHIACLQETYLKNTSKIYIEGYLIHRNNRGSHGGEGGGGVAILIKKDLKHQVIDAQSTAAIENISILVPVGNTKIIVTSAYNPQPTPHLRDDLSLLTSHPNETLILGDLNANTRPGNAISSTTPVEIFTNSSNRPNMLSWHLGHPLTTRIRALPLPPST